MAEQAQFNPMRFLDANGDPVPGALVYFFITGTSTLETVYTESTLATPHPSPLVADAQGVVPPVWHAADHLLKVNATDALGATLNGFPLDPAFMTETATAASQVTFTPITDNAASDVQQAIANNTLLAAASRDTLANQWDIPVSTGSGNAYAMAATETILAYADNQAFLFLSDRTNTGAVTLNIDGLGAKSIRGYDNVGAVEELAADAILAYNIVRVVYDGTQFIMLDRRAARDRRGPVQRSTSVENLAGTETQTFPDVAGVKEMIDNHVYEARAIMDGTGTPAFTVNDGFSASITDNGTGDYTLAFSTAQPDVNFFVKIWTTSSGATASNGLFCMPYSITTAGFSFRVTLNAGGGSAATDKDTIFIEVQRI